MRRRLWREADKTADMVEMEESGFLGDRPLKSLIFQCFRDIGLVAIPILASLGCFLPGGDPKTNSYSIHFSFAEMWYDASVAAGSVGRKDPSM